MTMNDTTRFDERLRSHHRASLEQLSPRVRAQLAQRRHAALAGTRPHRSHRLGLAVAGFATLCALAVGMQFRNPPTASQAADTLIAGTNAIPSRADSIILDQDPDFYAWLASPDAMQVAME